MKKKENKGFFISLEGGEGCGKSTQLNLLANALRIMFPGREVIATRSPGGTAVAEKIRSVLKEKTADEEIIPAAELLLFGACHAQMVHNLIDPAMKRGAILITDRFYDSTIVYQGYARGLDRTKIDWINTFACRGTKPDLTLLLDLSPEQGTIRTHSRAAVENDRFDSETDIFHRKIRAGFLDLAKNEPDRFAIIDATASIEEVHSAVMEVIHERLA